MLDRLISQYLSAILDGDRFEVRKLLDKAVAELESPVEALLSVVVKVQQEIGELWHAGKLSIAEEHRATAMNQEEIARLRELIPRRKNSGLSALVTVPPGEQHSVAAQIISSIFWADGWDVLTVVDPLPTEELVKLCELQRVKLLVFSVTTPGGRAQLIELTNLMKTKNNELKIIAGGRGLMNSDSIEEVTIIQDPMQAPAVARKLVGPVDFSASLEQVLRSLGQRIQSLRKEQRLSQQQVADKAGLKRTYISAIESGKQNLTVSALLKLSHALNVPLGELVN